MSLFLSHSTLHNQLFDYTSLNVSETIEHDCLSVLHKLHDQVNGPQLVQVVVQPLARLFNPAALSSPKPTGGPSNATNLLGANNSLSQPTSTYMMSPDTAQALIARLDTDRDVNWLMEIIGYGLSMPFSLTGEQDSVKDCCTIYLEWLSASLLPFNDQNDDFKYQQLSKLVPVPIRNDPNRYSRKMLSHLYNVFLPRQNINSLQSATPSNNNLKDQSDSNIARQAVLCHRVLRTLENIAQNRDNLLDNETWDHLIALLLTVNYKLLAPPTQPDIGTHLQDRILGVLFDLILIASSKSIPTPNHWRTFHEMCLTWRHRPALIDHWRRITLLLTKRIVSLSYKNSFYRKGQSGEGAAHSLETLSQSGGLENAINSMTYENLTQTWYKFLNITGNPVELTDPNIISKSDEFFSASRDVSDYGKHPCLSVLPQMFMNSMAALRDYVDTFLGTPECPVEESRPKCNSLLHLFGDWLFSAAFVGSDMGHELNQTMDSANIISNDDSLGNESSSIKTESSNQSSRERRFSDSKNSISQTSTKQQGSSFKHRGSISGSEVSSADPQLSAECFEAGQAEAIAVLCKIFSSRTSSEDISPNYLSRFYLCLQHCLTLRNRSDQKGLQYNMRDDSSIRRLLLGAVLNNSSSLFQRDLDGINLLIPSFISAIEYFFESGERDAPVQPPPRQHSRSGSIKQGPASQTKGPANDLRKSCIQTLLNFLAYPYHFKNLGIRSCLNDSSPPITFGSLRPKLIKLLFIALQTESDPTNMQVLFGGLALAIHDLAYSRSKTPKEELGKFSKQRYDSLSTHESQHTSHDSSINRQDESSGQTSFVASSNAAFLVKSLHVTCHLLINIWKHDTQVSLAALDLLTMIARVTATPELTDFNDAQTRSVSHTRPLINNNNNSLEMKNEYNQATKWICDYICSQCSRPPPAHSRDMHSTIVAAYQCLAVWFFNHPYLLNDESCVNTLMEVIELGVSGQKSRSLSLDSSGKEVLSTINKADKVLKPSSMRVREAAESLLNVCMVRSRMPGKNSIHFSDDSTLSESELIELFGGQAKFETNINRHSNHEARRIESFKSFKYFSDEDSVIFGFFENGSKHDQNTKDSVICLLRTPFGKFCSKLKFNYHSEQSKDKIISNRTMGLIKRPFQQCVTPTSENRPFNFTSGQNKSLYFNNNARFFPETVDQMQLNDLDKLVDTLDDYFRCDRTNDPRLKNDLDKLTKIFKHQVLAEQNVMSDSMKTRTKRLACDEPQASPEFDATRMIVTQLGLRSSLSSLTNDDKISMAFVNDLRSLDDQPIKTCDSASIFYVRKNCVSPKEILESVKERRHISLEFFEWLLELAQPIVVKNHSRWTGKRASSWSSKAVVSMDEVCGDKVDLSRNQMLASDHGGALFDGERMTLYWSDMCQELAFLVPHKIEKSIPQQQCKSQQFSSDIECNSNINQQDPNNSDTSSQNRHQDSHNSDVQSLCSVTSDASSQSTRAVSQQGSPRAHSARAASGEQRDSVSISTRHSVTQKKKVTHSLTNVGCDTNIIICWLESPDDLAAVPSETLLMISETGLLVDDDNSSMTDSAALTNSYSTSNQPPNNPSTVATQNRIRSREFAKYYISPMKNGLYRINLEVSFGRRYLALPLVDGMTVSQRTLSPLIRESILNLCRRRRLDADSYQPPHVKRRLKIQEICNNYKISGRYDSAEYYNNLFKNKAD